MNELINNKAKKINDLHKSAILTARKTIEFCIEAGELLSQVKDELKHGEFNLWCKENLELSRSTIFRYMKLYGNREVIHEANSPSEALRIIDKCSNLKHLENKILFQISEDQLEFTFWCTYENFGYPIYFNFREKESNVLFYRRAIPMDIEVPQMKDYNKNKFFDLTSPNTIISQKYKDQDKEILKYINAYKHEIQKDRIGKEFEFYEIFEQAIYISHFLYPIGHFV